MYMLFYQETARKKEQHHNKPAVFSVDLKRYRKEKNQQHLKAQIPPGTNQHSAPKHMTHTKEIHNDTDNISKHSGRITEGICNKSHAHTKYKWN